jgi:tetratricopeptide (TPR) repeat protein
MERIMKLKEFLKANPGDSFVLHALALEHVKLGDDAEARKIFEDLLNHNEKYIGSYYHLAKLLERTGEREEAIKWYEKGMKMAQEAGDRHAFSELSSAWEDLVF